MQIGYVGLGRMGAAMVERLLEKQYEVHAFDSKPEARNKVQAMGASVYESLEGLIKELRAPRTIWVMVPRSSVEKVLGQVIPLLNQGDTIIEGGNSYFEESIQRAHLSEAKHIGYVDVGVSGGVEGARHGACLMIGGTRELFEKYRGLFSDLSIEGGFGYMGTAGAGHFVKMVHNAIEYGMMGAIAEGMQSIRERQNEFRTDQGEVIKVYAHGSIIAGRLMNWLNEAWKADPDLTKLPTVVPYGETEEEMEKLERLSQLPILEASRKSRIATREGKENLIGQVINALRFQFGGHDPNKK